MEDVFVLMEQMDVQCLVMPLLASVDISKPIRRIMV